MSQQITYEYYRNGYFGYVLEENVFNKYLGEAVRCVSRLTSGSSEREEYSNEPKVKNAVCAAAEAAYQAYHVLYAPLTVQNSRIDYSFIASIFTTAIKLSTCILSF